MLTSPNRKKYLLATDLDGTLIGDSAPLSRLNNLLIRDRSSILLLYVTGRTLSSAWRLITAESLLLPDAVITDVGSGIHPAPHFEQDPDWAGIMSLNWDPVATAKVVESMDGLRRQDICPPFRLAYYADTTSFTSVVLLLRRLVREACLPVQIVPSMGCIVDIIPQGAGKGEAIRHVREQYAFDKNNIYVCGDSGNDLSMFLQGFKGIAVGNARDELTDALKHGTAEVYFSKTNHASGILEGLQYYGLF